MCTILFSWKSHPKYPLILIANRDEFYERETKTAHWWDDHPEILGGRDLKAGGTWMGIRKDGRFAAVTNFRKLPIEKTFETSRGDLVKDFLTGEERPLDYMKYVRNEGHNFEGFNLIFGTPDEMYYYGNMGGGFRLNANVYGLSNAVLDTPWRKVTKGKERFAELVYKDHILKEDFFKILADEEKAPDNELPKTGLDLEMERLVSSVFIKSERYGTRLSSVMTIDDQGKVRFSERSFIPASDQEFEFQIENKT